MKSKWIKYLAIFLAIGVSSTWIQNTAAAERASRFRSGSEVRDSKSVNIIKENGKNVGYQKKTTVDFDDALIEGEVKNPNEFYFVHRPEEKFGSLVKKRKNFNKEMLRDAVMIR